MEQILNLQHISYTYHTLEGETPALSDISFSLNKGEFAAIVGPSGCGKSTLLSLICGLLPCSDGQITINGRHLKESTTNVGYMLQHDELFEWRTIYNNVILGLEIQHALTARTKKRAHELLNIYGLSDFENSRPSELSGGMRQRAALIRTLVLEPELLLLDEPFSALDYQTRLQVGDDIGQIIRNEKKSALLVTHDLSEAISLADRVLVGIHGSRYLQILLAGLAVVVAVVDCGRAFLMGELIFILLMAGMVYPFKQLPPVPGMKSRWRSLGSWPWGRNAA